MKTLFAINLLIFVTACSHPLEIVGNGDIISSTGKNDCLWEDRSCANYVTGDYDVTYAALPEAGWIFSGWEGCGDQWPKCSFKVPSGTVDLLWGKTAPALTAVFTQIANYPSITTSTVWSAVAATLTIEVSASIITPTTVRLYPNGIDDAWVEVDTSAPFSFTIDASAFTPGDHEMVIIASDGDMSVSKNELITVSGCNGTHSLCSRSYDTVRYATTHNAMSNAANGWVGPNQNLTVPDQLALGVRALMLDNHKAGNLNSFNQIQVPDADPDTAYLCHAVCSLGKQLLENGLSEIVTFLDGNPGAVVTLIIESYLPHDLTAAAFNAANLKQYAYQHEGGAWPTLGQMIDMGMRLVVLQDVSVDPAYPWLMNVWDHAFETNYSAAVPEDFSCDINRGTGSNDLFIFNNFLTNVFGSPALAEQVNHNPALMDRIGECEAVHATPANFVTVDFIDIGDTILAIQTLNDSGGF
jgi:hypothetical protein